MHKKTLYIQYAINYIIAEATQDNVRQHLNKLFQGRIHDHNSLRRNINMYQFGFEMEYIDALCVMKPEFAPF